jgi:hypothetical protein
MRRFILRVVPMVLIDLLAGPMIGMLIGEYLAENPSDESGFIGFLYGLWIGPAVGLMLGLALVFLWKPSDPTQD